MAKNENKWDKPRQMFDEKNPEIEKMLDELLIERGEHPTRVRNPLYGEERLLAKDLLEKFKDKEKSAIFNKLIKRGFTVPCLMIITVVDIIYTSSMESFWLWVLYGLYKTR